MKACRILSIGGLLESSFGGIIEFCRVSKHNQTHHDIHEPIHCQHPSNPITIMPALNAQDAYRRIIQTAHNIALVTEQPCSSRFLDSPSSNFELNLDLPQPTPIISTLLDDGVPLKVAERLSELFLRISADLKDRITASFRDTCSKVSHTPKFSPRSTKKDIQDQLVLTFRALYDQRVSTWLSEIRRTASSRSKEMRKDDDGGSQRQVVQKTFNHV